MLDLQIVDCFVSFPLSYTYFTSNQIVLLPKKSDVCISRMFSFFSSKLTYPLFLQRVSHKSLKDSFTEFPACELQFKSACQPAKGSFFGVLSFTQPCFGETVIYVHVPAVQKVITITLLKCINLTFYY